MCYFLIIEHVCLQVAKLPQLPKDIVSVSSVVAMALIHDTVLILGKVLCSSQIFLLPAGKTLLYRPYSSHRHQHIRNIHNHQFTAAQTDGLDTKVDFISHFLTAVMQYHMNLAYINCRYDRSTFLQLKTFLEKQRSTNCR